ncbi:MAG: LL-diaminopimelate aminotransferase [Oscillospiraceae bacterium]|nr:LL-diaminopimelate aminotransferase [Oscillospiraceae bacterium]
MKVNHYALQLENNYLFSEIASRLRAFQKEYPDRTLLKCSIGDVTRPLPRILVETMKNAAEEMAHPETFRGYGAEQGELFLREAIAQYYAKRGLSVHPEDIFVSDGAKSDLGNLCDLFDADNTVLLPNPVYPVYYDTSIMSGRHVVFLEGSQKNEFLPMPDFSVHADIIYLCSPNNPTGAVYNREQLAEWVAYALEQKAILLFDAAYESYIQDASLPHSIFEIEGAEQCALEINSLSKMAGFTGVRCGWTVVPRTLVLDGASLHQMWFRRMATKYNGTSYIIQRTAAKVFTEEGQQAVREDIAYYMENAHILKKALNQAGIWSTGGDNAPYVWLKAPNNLDSWEFFDELLNRYGIAGTPGAGFGTAGEGYLRFSSFASRETIQEAAKLLENLDFSGKSSK